jgi:predicted nucleic acid-binding protein
LAQKDDDDATHASCGGQAGFEYGLGRGRTRRTDGGAARTDLLERIEAFVPLLARVLPFDEAAARIFGPLKAELQRLGTPLDEADLRVASIALANNLTPITGDERHVRRVRGLASENRLRADT